MFGQKQVAKQPSFADPPVPPAPAAQPTLAPTAPVRQAQADNNNTLVRSDLFRVVRNGVFASINASAAVGKTREQMKPAVEQLVQEVTERERLEHHAGRARADRRRTAERHVRPRSDRAAARR